MIWFPDKLTSEMLKSTKHQIQRGLYDEFAETVEHYIFNALCSGVGITTVKKVQRYVRNTCKETIYPKTRYALSNLSKWGDLDRIDNQLYLLEFCCKYIEMNSDRMSDEFTHWAMNSVLDKALEKSKEGDLERAIYLMSAKNYADKHPDRVDKKNIYDRIDQIQQDYPSHLMRRKGWYGPRGPM